MKSTKVIKLDTKIYSNDKQHKKHIKVIEFGKSGSPNILMSVQSSSEYIKKRNTFSLTDEGVVLELTPILEEFKETFSLINNYFEGGCCNWGYAILFYDIKSIENIIEMLNKCKKKLVDEQLQEILKEQRLLEMSSPNIKHYVELENKINLLTRLTEEL